MAKVSCDKCGKSPSFLSQFPIFSCPNCHHRVCTYCTGKSGIMGFGGKHICPFCKKQTLGQSDVITTH